MTLDCLKLTCYFGERDRAGGQLLADRLLDLCGSRGVRASVLLRGAEGFGGMHRLRTDRLLTLSEDLPAVAIAVDRRERIEALLDDLAAIERRGLVTLERARMIDGAEDAADPPHAPGEEAKLTVYLGRGERVGRQPAYAAVTALLHRRGIAGASVLLGVDGTRAGRRVRARFFAGNAEVPAMIIAVGAGERIAPALPELRSMLPEPLVTLERVRVCKRDGVLLAAPHAPDERGPEVWQKLMVHTSQATTREGHAVSTQIVRRLLEAGAAGATTIRGVWGFRGDHAPHGDRFFQIRRRVPEVTVVIDTPERIARSFAVIDELTDAHGLVTSELVPSLLAPSGGRAPRTQGASSSPT